jgi:hypothetical protein
MGGWLDPRAVLNDVTKEKSYSAGNQTHSLVAHYTVDVSSGSKLCSVADSCEPHNESSGSIKDRISCLAELLAS